MDNWVYSYCPHCKAKPGRKLWQTGLPFPKTVQCPICKCDFDFKQNIDHSKTTPIEYETNQ